MTRSEIFKQIHDERLRQDAKWGIQNHDAFTWLAILTEETGEVSKAIIDALWNGSSPIDYRNELIQVAAVALSAIECFDRNDGRLARREEVG